MNFGDEVIFMEKGVERSAIVMSVSVANETAGRGGEPSLALAFFGKPFLPEYRYDVRHQSHNDQGSYWREETEVEDLQIKLTSAKGVNDALNAELLKDVEEIAALRSENAELRAKASALPSAADLDAHAEEQKAAPAQQAGAEKSDGNSAKSEGEPPADEGKQNATE